jgi:hypothetical protein
MQPRDRGAPTQRFVDSQGSNTKIYQKLIASRPFQTVARPQGDCELGQAIPRTPNTAVPAIAGLNLSYLVTQLASWGGDMCPRCPQLIPTAVVGVRSRLRLQLDCLGRAWCSSPLVRHTLHCKAGLRFRAEGSLRGVVGDGAT